MAKRDRRDRVTTLLDKVVYDDGSEYTPTFFALDMLNFIKLVGGTGGEEHVSPIMHLKMLDNADDNSKDAVANLCHRGSAKTTVFGEYLILYCAVKGGLPSFGEFKYGLYISDSIENGVKKMRLRLERKVANSEYLRQMLSPETKFTDIRWYFKNAAGKELVFNGFGAETGVRGTVELGERPSIAIFDDLMSDKNAKSPTIVKSIKDTVYGAVDYALHPKRNKVIWNGTPFNARDPLYQAINSPSWAANVYPVCEKFPCTEEEFRSSWPDRFDYNYVAKKYQKAIENDSMAMFNKELMLRIATAEEQLVLEEDILYFDYSRVAQHKENFTFYITTDFASTASDSADWSVAMVIAVNNVGHWLLVDGFCKKQLMSDNISDLFGLVRKWKPIEVGLEISGQQGGYVSWLDEKMMEYNVFFTIAKETENESSNYGKRGFKPATNKIERFLLALPMINEIKFKVANTLKNTVLVDELIDELTLATKYALKSLHDDAIDAFSMMRRFKIIKPSENSGDSYESSKMKDNSKYDTMKDAGMYSLNPFEEGGSVFDDYFEDESDEYGVDNYLV